MKKIDNRDELILKLLDYSDTDRLERHADVEIALAGKHAEVKMLTEALSNKEKENASLRYDIRKYEKIFVNMDVSNV